jgi:drug/metabolite transporter (DMT)-like permease
MLPAILTTVFFALSAASAGRSTRMLGGSLANVARLSLATLWLACWAYGFGQGTGGPSFVWFVLSGIVGFGVGDLALYSALPRIGARLAVLLTQCLAAPLGAAVEWLWLGTALNAWQILWGTVILAGVALALWPDPKADPRNGTQSPHWVAGTIFGIIAGIGQGGGAVITRKAYAVAEQAGWHIDGGTAAFQRIIGGMSLTLLVLAVYHLVRQHLGHRVRHAATTPRARHPWGKAWPWVLVNSVAGPAVGVACYQWALSIVPTGVVLAIVATTPLVVIPFTMVLEGERPSIQSLIGGVIAVLGAIALTLVSH